MSKYQKENYIGVGYCPDCNEYFTRKAPKEKLCEICWHKRRCNVVPQSVIKRYGEEKKRRLGLKCN